MEVFDAVVVGTGPGGAFAALRLAETGARVLILEKEKLPRDKACGGALTTAAVMPLLDWDLSAIVESEINSSRFQFARGQAVTVQHETPVLCVNRSHFDFHIVERALRCGASLRDDFFVTHAEERPEGVTVTGKSGEKIQARHLVGADGANGRVAAALSLGRRTAPGLAIDAEIEVTADIWNDFGSQLRFEFGLIPGGYGWVFPKKASLSCGIASWTGAYALPAALEAFLLRTLPRGSIRSQKKRGHPIPLYEGPARIATARACLVGDAAGLVDPIMGEGIRYALISGAIAAAVISQRLQNGSSANGLDYTQQVHAAIGADLDRLRRFILPFFLKNPAGFYRNFLEQGASYGALAATLDVKLSASAAASRRSVQS
jgi:geranylgeranyl reductase family protein